MWLNRIHAKLAPSQWCLVVATLRAATDNLGLARMVHGYTISKAPFPSSSTELNTTFLPKCYPSLSGHATASDLTLAINWRNKNKRKKLVYCRSDFEILKWPTGIAQNCNEQHS